MIDQYIASSESKWGKSSGLVMLLPHGYEGQGPEHSSARLGRSLQLCAEFNLVITNITSPSNFFHALRRQVKWPFRKPLINMSPKSLLRHPEVESPIEELFSGGFPRADRRRARRGPEDGQAPAALLGQGLFRPA